MDALSMLWDNVSRDMDEERAELARTAALADAEKTLWPLMSGAADATDLGHRLALADTQISLIAARRGYDRGELVGDLMRRWQLLAEAKTAQSPRRMVGRSEKEIVAHASDAADLAYFQAVATLTARAASDNPSLPLKQCQALAEEALAKQADAYPLAYESWGHVEDGPMTKYVKNFKPPGVKPKTEPSDPGTSDGGSGMFDDVSARLDAAEQRINGTGGGAGSAPSGPGGPTGPKSASHQHEAGPFTDRIKQMMPGRRKQQAPSPNPDRGMFNEVNDRLDAADRKLNPTKPSDATIPGTVPDLDLSEYLKGPDRVVEQNSHGNSGIFEKDEDDNYGLHQLTHPQFADRRIDDARQKIRDEQARSDATEPSFDDLNSNMERRLNQGEQANQQSRMDAGPQPAVFSDEPRRQHAPVPQGSNSAPTFQEPQASGAASGFDQPHNHSHSHPASYLQDSLFD